MRKRGRAVLQRIYGLFDGAGGRWPSLRELKLALIHDGIDDVDAVRIVRHIPPELMKPLSHRNGYRAMHEELVLTAEGINICMGSFEDIDNLVSATRWLARWVERADLPSGQPESGISFTFQQLAMGVPLSLDTDSHAIGKLLALMEAEGWVQVDDGTQVGLPTRLLAAPEVVAFRSIRGFRDYVRTKRDLGRREGSASGWMRRWQSVLSLTGLTAIIAVGTVLLVLLALLALLAV